MEYPTTFDEQLRPVQRFYIDDTGSQSLDSLADAGFEVFRGVREADVDAVTAIAGQEGVREFCPNDMGSRFANREKMAKWLTKGGGRGFFQLRSEAGLAGYGWTGAEDSKHVPDSEVTFAIRLSVDPTVAGRGLAKHFTNVIVSASMFYNQAENIWLETWASNARAVSTYQKAGALLVASKADARPTVGQVHDFRSRDGEPYVHDTRLFMQFDRTFRQAA